MAPFMIKTSVDKLVDLVSKEEKLSLKAAAKKLGVGITTVEEWADFLEEEGLITVEHSLSGVFLIPRKLSKTEVKSKVKEYCAEKEGFVRKVNSAMTNIEREAEDVRVLRAEFRNIHKEIGDDLGKIQKELSNIGKFQEYEERIRKKKNDFEQDYNKKIDDMFSKVTALQRKISAMSKTKAAKTKEVNANKKKLDTLLQKERALLASLKKFETAVFSLEKQLHKTEEVIDADQKGLDKMKDVKAKYEAELTVEKAKLSDLIDELNEERSKLKSLEDDFLSKLRQSSTFGKTKLDNAKKVQATCKQFFSKYDQIKDIMDDLDKEYTSIESELNKLSKKATAYDVTLKAGDAKSYIKTLEAELKKLDGKRSMFRSEIRKLKNVLKKRL